MHATGLETCGRLLLVAEAPHVKVAGHRRRGPPSTSTQLPGSLGLSPDAQRLLLLPDVAQLWLLAATDVDAPELWLLAATNVDAQAWLEVGVGKLRLRRLECRVQLETHSRVRPLQRVWAFRVLHKPLAAAAVAGEQELEPLRRGAA